MPRPDGSPPAAEPAIAERGRFTIAVSGGSTPAAMFAELARLDLPWPQVHVFEVDERVAPDGDPDRNLNDLRANLLDLVPVVAHLMDVTAADLPGACRRYADELSDVTGDGVLDVVHLGLGDDGHTASWPPGDPVINVRDADVRAHPALSRTGPDDPDRPRGQPGPVGDVPRRG